MYKDLGDQVENLILNIIEIVYFMRGGLPYDEAMELSILEKSLYQTFLNKHLEREVKKLYPNY